MGHVQEEKVIVAQIFGGSYRVGFCCRFEPPGPGAPVLAEGEPGQRGEHARLPDGHPAADPRAERGPGDNPAAAEPEPAGAAQHAERVEPVERVRAGPGGALEGRLQLRLHAHQLHVRPPEPEPPPAGAQPALHLRRPQLPEAEQPRPAQVAALQRLPEPADLAAPDPQLRSPAQLRAHGTFHSGTQRQIGGSIATFFSHSFSSSCGHGARGWAHDKRQPSRIECYLF